MWWLASFLRWFFVEWLCGTRKSSRARKITISLFLIKAEKQEADKSFEGPPIPHYRFARYLRQASNGLWRPEICFRSIVAPTIFEIFIQLFSSPAVGTGETKEKLHRSGAGSEEIFLFLFHAWSNLKIWPWIGREARDLLVASSKTCLWRALARSDGGGRNFSDLLLLLNTKKRCFRTFFCFCNEFHLILCSSSMKWLAGEQFTSLSFFTIVSVSTLLSHRWQDNLSFLLIQVQCFKSVKEFF